jgi:xanthine dehydrogenase small subunit
MTSFVLNGQPRILDNAEPSRTVLEHLRLHERLTATKEGCAEGDCGACTIAVGKPDSNGGLKFQAVNSCILLASELDGTVVVTADGLASDGVLEQTQRALVDSHGSQCGFCTPGFVMSLFAHTQTPQPLDGKIKADAIYDALSGNLCRCTGYRPIVDAAALLQHKADPRIHEWRATLDALVDDGDDDCAPRSLQALDSLLAQNPSAKLLNGGTDLGVGIAKYGNVPELLISLRRVAGLGVAMETNDALIVGATTTYSEMLPYLERHFPAFAALVRRIGSVQIRNLGTMGGNICNASPIGDAAPCLLALGAQLTIRSTAGRRSLPIDSFFVDYRKTALQPGEYLESIIIPFLQPDEKFFAYKIAKRFDQDISTIAAAFWMRIADRKISAIRSGFGGMAATPARATSVENALLGQTLSQSLFTKTTAVLSQDFSPLSDFRATAEYRQQAAAGLITRLGAQLLQPAQATDIWVL